jgi:hypothetical protein
MRFETQKKLNEKLATMSAGEKTLITTLSLSNTQVSDVTALAGLTNLNIYR